LALGRAVASVSGMNDLGKFVHVFDGVTPWSGAAPTGYAVDFLGVLSAEDFLQATGWPRPPRAPNPFRPGLPTLGDGSNGEFWFEAADWIIAAREARDRFVMVTLGAFYGYQAVGSCRALTLLNPMPYKLVAVEPMAEKIEWLRRHMRDNGIDPDRQWLIQSVVGASNEPVLFPVGAAPHGGHNCIATNDLSVRRDYLHALIAQGRSEEALSNLLLRNSTGMTHAWGPEQNFAAEVKFMSSVTIADVLGPFEFVDYMESDLQESEKVAFPPCMDVLKKKVRRIHIGTHGTAVHAMLHALFAEHGWEIVFSYPPDSTHSSPAGPFTTTDGILTVRNPHL
jgi:hypothetical protein